MRKVHREGRNRVGHGRICISEETEKRIQWRQGGVGEGEERPAKT